jgi:hypothetical protein
MSRIRGSEGEECRDNVLARCAEAEARRAWVIVGEWEARWGMEIGCVVELGRCSVRVRRVWVWKCVWRGVVGRESWVGI